MSGRREAQVSADARLLAQASYIYEAGCGVVIDGERTLLTGDWVPDADGTPAEKMLAAGVPDLLFERFPGRLEWHGPWHVDRVLSHLFRGRIDVAEANALLAEQGHDDLRFLDNGAIVRRMEGLDGPAHAYHLVPGGASKAKAVAFHMRARGYAPEECIGVGDSLEDLDAAVGRGEILRGRQRRPSAIRGCARRSAVGPTSRSPRAATATASTRRWCRPWPRGASGR